MDEYHTFVNTMTALTVKCGNLWEGPFFELQMACLFYKESRIPIFLNPQSKTIEVLFFYRYQLALPSLLSLVSQVVKPCQFGKPTQKNVQAAVVLHICSIWKYHDSNGICFAPCLCTPKLYSKQVYPQYLSMFFT